MPLQKIELRPGINRESTTYSNEGGYYSGDKIRFRSGFPEKIGGWTRLSNTTFLGTCRALVNWTTLSQGNYVGVGTNLKYYIESGGLYNDVTPIIAVSIYNSKMSVPYTTLNGTITAESTTLTLTSTVGFAPSGVIKIDSEQIYYGSISGAALSLLSRGYNSTTAASHTTGAGVGTSTITFNDTDNDGQNNDFITCEGTAGFAGISDSALHMEHQITKVTDSYFYFTIAETALGTLSNVAITGINGQFSCAASSPIKALFGNSVVISGVNSGGGSIAGYVNPTKYWIIAANAGGTTFTLSATQNGLPIDSAAGTPVGLTFTATKEAFSTSADTGHGLSSIVLTGITGAFTCASTDLAVGKTVGITGNWVGTGSISGYTNPKTYYIILTNGTTTFTLSDTPGGAAITTTAGTPTPSGSGGPFFGLGGGGTLTSSYQVHAGLDVYVAGTGWGSGSWGRGTYNSNSVATTGSQLRLWTHDNYGEDLLFAPRGGTIYYWVASDGLSSRGVLLSERATNLSFPGTYVPHTTNQIITSGDSRFVVALGANSYLDNDPDTAFDPMLVRWSDQENPYQWVPSVTNQTGETRLSSGSYIVCGQTTRQEMLIWTNNALYSMQYLGPPYVFGINMMSDESSIISPNAAFTVNNVTYWMGTDKFYSYSGRVETLPCTLRQYIYSDINKDQSYQIFCGGNEGFNEVWWFYCSANSTTIDKYVVYNHLERLWYYGTMARTAWLDSSLRPFPMASNYDNRNLYHEAVVDDESGDTTAAIYAYIESSDFDINDGHNFGFVWRMLPDVSFVGSTPPAGTPPQVLLSIDARRNSGSPYGNSATPAVTRVATYPIEEYTGQVYTRVRGRQMYMRIESDRIGTKWQLGAVRIDIRTDGRR